MKIYIIDIHKMSIHFDLVIKIITGNTCYENLKYRENSKYGPMYNSK